MPKVKISTYNQSDLIIFVSDVQVERLESILQASDVVSEYTVVNNSFHPTLPSISSNWKRDKVISKDVLKQLISATKVYLFHLKEGRKSFKEGNTIYQSLCRQVDKIFNFKVEEVSIADLEEAIELGEKKLEELN